MSFGRGMILQAIKREVNAEVADDLKHQLRMSWASDYTNQSIEKFCQQLSERHEYESSNTCGQTFGELPVLHSDQFDDSEDCNSGIPEALHQKSNEVSSSSSYLKELENSEVQSTFTKSSNDPDADCVDRFRVNQSNDKKGRRRRKRVRAKKSSFSHVIPEQEVDDNDTAVIYEGQPKILNESFCGGTNLNDVEYALGGHAVEFHEDKTEATQFEDCDNVLPSEFHGHEEDLNSCSEKIVDSGKVWSVEEAFTRECDDYYDDMNNHASASKVHFGNGIDELNSSCSKEKLPLFNPQSKTGAIAKVIGRGQRLQMVVDSLPLDSRREIAMGCDPTYTNQSIENFLAKLTMKIDEEGCY